MDRTPIKYHHSVGIDPHVGQRHLASRIDSHASILVHLDLKIDPHWTSMAMSDFQGFPVERFDTYSIGVWGTDWIVRVNNPKLCS